MRFAILIPIHNGLETTKKCLQLIVKQTNQVTLFHKETIQFEIIIIDDGSIDNSSEWITNNFQMYGYLRGDGNLWWSGAINLGAKYAIETLNSEFIILWNNDIYANEKYFINLISKITTYPTISIFGSLVYVDCTNEIHSCGGYFNKVTGRRFTYTSFNVSNEFKKVDWLPGMGTIIKSDVLKSIGYWDEKKFPQYMGDSDYTLRALKNNFQPYVFYDLVIENNINSTVFM